MSMISNEGYNFREMEEKDNDAIAAIVRSSLKRAGLDIPGTAYFDEKLDALSEVYGEVFIFQPEVHAKTPNFTTTFLAHILM